MLRHRAGHADSPARHVDPQLVDRLVRGVDVGLHSGRERQLEDVADAERGARREAELGARGGGRGGIRRCLGRRRRGRLRRERRRRHQDEESRQTGEPCRHGATSTNGTGAWAIGTDARRLAVRSPEPVECGDEPGIPDDDGQLAPPIERGWRQRDAADDGRGVVDHEQLAVRAQWPEHPLACDLDGHARPAPCVEQAAREGIGQLRVDQPDAVSRLRQQRRETAARGVIRSDDEALALGCRQLRRACRPVGGKERGQARHHRGIARHEQEITGALEAFRREVERGHERDPLVGDDVLGVILRPGAAAADLDAVGGEPFGHPIEAARAGLGPCRHDGADAHAARGGLGQRSQHRLVVAPEDRQRELPPGRADERRRSRAAGRTAR